MLDKFEAKGKLLKYYLDTSCLIKYSYKDRISGGKIYCIKMPNSSKTEYLDVKILDSPNGCTIRMEGNLRKWKYGSKSAVCDLNYDDYCLSIRLKRLGVVEDWIWNLELTYIELGGNLKLPRSYERFIPGLLSYPELSLERWTESTVYFTGIKYRLIFYDKLKEMRANKVISERAADKIIKKLFILRFEIKIKAKSGYRKKECVHDFVSIRENWNLLLDDWFDAYKKAKPVDLFSDSIEVKKGTLTKRQAFDYGSFLLVNEIGIDRGLYSYQYVMKNRKNEAVDYIQYLFKKY